MIDNFKKEIASLNKKALACGIGLNYSPNIPAIIREAKLI